MKERLFRMGERVVRTEDGRAGKIIKIKLIRSAYYPTLRHLIVYFGEHCVATCLPEELELDVLGELAR
jgi:hypothetical protein